MVKRKSTPRPYNAWTMSESEVRSRILAKLRQFTMYWKPKGKCLQLAAGKCAHCSKKFKTSELKADHILPIVPVKGWEKKDDLVLWYNWNEWIRNALVEVDWYQALCSECHSKKTKKENADRKKNKK